MFHADENVTRRTAVTVPFQGLCNMVHSCMTVHWWKSLHKSSSSTQPAGANSVQIEPKEVHLFPSEKMIKSHFRQAWKEEALDYLP